MCLYFLLYIVILSTVTSLYVPGFHLLNDISTKTLRKTSHNTLYSTIDHTTQSLIPHEKHLFIFGLGYVGTSVIQQLKSINATATNKWHINGTTESNESIQNLIDNYNISCCKLSELTSDTLINIIKPTHVLITIPPVLMNTTFSIGDIDTDGNKSSTSNETTYNNNKVIKDAISASTLECKISNVICKLLIDYMKAIPDRLIWVGYLSSTGVYKEPSSGNLFLNELSELLVEATPATATTTTTSSPSSSSSCEAQEDPLSSNPQFNSTPVLSSSIIQTITSKGAARVIVENQWLKYQEVYKLPVHIFRLAGIYGPQRSLLQRLQQADGDINQCSASSSVLVNRIHVDDVAQVLYASMNRPEPGLVVNVADCLPATQYDVLKFTCSILGLPVATNSDNSTDGENVNDASKIKKNPSKTRGSSKRVSNARMIHLLSRNGLTMRYPTYISGMRSLLQEWRDHL